MNVPSDRRSCWPQGRAVDFKGSAHKLAQRLGSVERARHARLRNAIASHLPVVVVTTEALADVARAQRRRARHRGRCPTERDRPRSAWAIRSPPVSRARADAAGLAAAAGRHAAGARRPRCWPWRAALEHHAVAYAQHHGRRGHPVGFSAELYSELMMLSGDEGARRLVARYPAIGVEVGRPRRADRRRHRGRPGGAARAGATPGGSRLGVPD